jgi:hypothetical protein
MATSIYRKLTGKARTLGGYSQLWLAPDHLLLLRSTGFRQQYWRFVLADIQAIVVTELPSRMPLQAALGGVALLWMLAYLAVISIFAKSFFLVTGGIALAVVIGDIARGPRCRCFLHTAVSREPLSPVRRMRVAEKVLFQLQSAIESVQGSIATEKIQQLDDRSSLQLPASAAPSNQPPEIAEAPGYLPEVVFGVFLINALLILASVRFHYAQINAVLVTTLFAEAMLLVVALIRRGSRDFRRYIYVLMMVAIVGIGWDVVMFAQSFGHWIGAVVDAGQHGRPAPVPVTPGAAFDRTHGLISGGWRVAASIIGLVTAHFERKQVKTNVTNDVEPNAQ